MKIKDNKIRKWKKGTRLFGTYTTRDKRIRRWGRRCKIIWWQPCNYYFTDEVPTWSSECPYKGHAARYHSEDPPKACKTYGYKPRFGKVSEINCGTIDDYYTDEELKKLEQEGKVSTW